MHFRNYISTGNTFYGLVSKDVFVGLNQITERHRNFWLGIEGIRLYHC